MRYQRSVFTAALVLASAASHADTFIGALDLSAGGAHFGRDNAIGTFEDTYTFTLLAPGYLISSSATSASPSPAHDIDLNNPLIKRGGLTIATFGGNFGTDANESYTLPSRYLAAGDYQLVISGINSPLQASYSGNLSVSAVPEPKSYAMFIAGLVALLAVSRSRPKDKSGRSSSTTAFRGVGLG
jgi:hypothetical protein